MAALTLAQIQVLILNATIAATGLDQKNVRFAYQSDTQPAWEINQNVIVIYVNYLDSQYDKNRDTQYVHLNTDHATENVSYTRVISVDWTLYGPDSFDNADILRTGLLIEDIRNPMDAQGVKVASEINAPRRIPYEFNNQYWQRVDLYAEFNVATLRNTIIPYFKSVTVEVVTDEGVQNTVHVSD